MQQPDTNWLQQLAGYLGSLGGTGFGGSMGTQAPLPTTGAQPLQPSPAAPVGAPPTPPGQPAAPTQATQAPSVAPTTTPQGAPAATPPQGMPAIPSTPGGSNALAGLPPGLGEPGFLDKPWVQAALAAYLGAIGSPRSRGMGGALSSGGLAGLQAYETARKDLYTPYLTAVDIQQKQAATEASRAETRSKTAEAAKAEAIGKTNKGFAQSIRDTYLQDPTLSQGEKNSWELTAQALDADESKAWEPKDIQASHDSWMNNQKLAQDVLSGKATQKKTEAETITEKAKPGEIAAHIDQMHAEASKSDAEAAKDRETLRQDKIYGPKIKQAELDAKDTEIAVNKVKIAKGPAEQAAAMNKLTDQLKKEYASSRGMPARVLRSVTGAETFLWLTQNFDKGEDAFVQFRLGQMGITGAGTSTSAPPAASSGTAAADAAFAKIPANAKPAYLNGHHGYVDASGKFTPVD